MIGYWAYRPMVKGDIFSKYYGKIAQTASSDKKCISAHIFANRPINSIMRNEEYEFLSQSCKLCYYARILRNFNGYRD